VRVGLHGVTKPSMIRVAGSYDWGDLAKERGNQRIAGYSTPDSWLYADGMTKAAPCQPLPFRRDASALFQLVDAESARRNQTIIRIFF